MNFQDPANPAAPGEPSGGAPSPGRPRASQPAARAILAYDYMDEEIEEAMIMSEPPAPMPPPAIGPSGRAGRD